MSASSSSRPSWVSFPAHPPLLLGMKARVLSAGLLGQILLGVIFGTPVGAWLERSWQEAWVALGYVGLLGLVFEGGLSTSLPTLIPLLPLSLLIALTGIALPLGLSFVLVPLLGASPLHAFAAGSALASTSLGTTLAVLQPQAQPQKQKQPQPQLQAPVSDIDADAISTAPDGRRSSIDGEHGGGPYERPPDLVLDLRKTKLGTALLGAAVMDDVVAFIFAKVLSVLGSGSSDADAGNPSSSLGAQLGRTLGVTFGLGLVLPPLARFILRPTYLAIITPHRLAALAPFYERATTTPALGGTTIVALLVWMALVCAATFGGTSALYGAYLAGLLLSYLGGLTSASASASALDPEPVPGSDPGRTVEGSAQADVERLAPSGEWGARTGPAGKGGDIELAQASISVPAPERFESTARPCIGGNAGIGGTEVHASSPSYRAGEHDRSLPGLDIGPKYGSAASLIRAPKAAPTASSSTTHSSVLDRTATQERVTRTPSSSTPSRASIMAPAPGTAAVDGRHNANPAASTRSISSAPSGTSHPPVPAPHPHPHPNPFERAFHAQLAPVLFTFLAPLFFASIGYSIPFLSLWRGEIVWKGVVYAVLMALGKVACGVWVVLASALARRQERGHGGNKGKGKSMDVNRIDNEEPNALALDAPDLQDAKSKWEGLKAGTVLGLGMVARGEIGLLISQIAYNAPTPLLTEDEYLVVIWAIVLCTIVGPVGVGWATKRWGTGVVAGGWE